MTYIDWMDELNKNLLSLPREERARVTSYFSEMYADKRDAGFSEKQIIAEFGAPYDAAKRVLGEEYPFAGPRPAASSENSGKTAFNAGYSDKNYGNYAQTPDYTQNSVNRQNMPQYPLNNGANAQNLPPQTRPAKKGSKAGKVVGSIFLALIGFMCISIAVSAAKDCVYYIINAAAFSLDAAEIAVMVGRIMANMGVALFFVGLVVLIIMSIVKKMKAVFAADKAEGGRL